MFKPLRLVYLEAVPEKGLEALTTKNFLGELKKLKYDEGKAKDAVNKGALTGKGGYKLIKAEALVATGKITTINDLGNAAAYDLEDKDIEAFLNQYGGDKYVKRLFEYGMSKMSRDFMSKKQNFEKEKKLGGKFEGLKQYATFEDAFNAGFYGEFAVNFNAIMEKGLSVSEYRQRDERFRKLEKKVKKIEQEGTKYPDKKFPERKEVEEKKVEVPEPQGTLEEAPKGPIEREKTEAEKERKLNIMVEKLSAVAKECRKSDILIPELVKKYKLEEINAGLEYTTPIVKNTDTEEAYVNKFLEKVTVKTEGSQHGQNLTNFIGGTQRLGKEVLEELRRGYNELITERLEKLVALETALYVKGDGTSGPRAKIPEINDEEKRKELEAEHQQNIKIAEDACPEIKDVQTLLKDLSKTAAHWRLRTIDYFELAKN